jgi:vanillate O-demethylase ferredoxin subunit
VHRWTGLTAGLVIVMMAVTGASIVFRPQLEPLINADLLTVAQCSERVTLDVLTANAQAARPAATLDYIRLQAGEPGAARMPAAAVRFIDQTFVYLNPCNGNVLGERHRYGGVLGTIEQVHRLRIMPNGSWITGTSVLLFAFVLVCGGLYLWLPAPLRGVKRALGLRPMPSGPARMSGLHRRLGIFASLIVLTSALTGLPQAFEWYKAAVYAVAGSSMHDGVTPRSQPIPGQARLPMEALWKRAQELVPQPREMLLHYPAKPRAAADMYLIAQDAPHYNARTMLYLDAYSGAVLKFTPYADSSAGHKLYFFTLSLHTGHVGGLPVQLLLLAGALSIPVLAYTGIASYLRRRRKASGALLPVRVASKVMEAQDLCTFELAGAGGRALPRFEAGDHIDVHLPGGAIRQYSLCNAPGETHRYLICVRRDANSRGGSRALHDEIESGQLLEVSAPKHRFPLDPAASHSLLLAGGVGVTPIISMAEQLAKKGASFEMHYCARSAERMAFLARIRNSRFAERVRFYFSDALPAQVIDFQALLSVPSLGTHLYVCGPRRFIDAACATAKLNGWPDSRVHKEHFSGDVAVRADDVAFDMRLERSGKTLRVPKGQTALAALIDAGVQIPRSCQQGTCGSCLTPVLEGMPLHRDSYLTEAERSANDCFTPCCSRARGGTLVLDL